MVLRTRGGRHLLQASSLLPGAKPGQAALCLLPHSREELPSGTHLTSCSQSHKATNLNTTCCSPLLGSQVSTPNQAQSFHGGSRSHCPS